ncbi:hypothetical protein [Hymenobacter sp. BT559]|uniref:hypothetical protein n=1 Tax=Hymenobacter sp. BT559 TaxID=2795729 RepID=UPI0018ECB413|nr:hypothetical protein [Hymenobacter sp. BT559]MBJ6143811.1 hypothetical protein [Hymenobacter sp. BT559]
MPPRVITLAYRKVLDATASKPWDKLVLVDSYRELRMQAQLYNPGGQYRTFGELLHYVPGADKLHFLVGGSIGGYVQQLKGVVPDIVNNVGRYFLKFTRYQFELINSDLHDQSKHQVAITFYAEPLHWHDSIAPYLLVSDAAAPAEASGEVLTHLVQLQPYLTIHSLHPAS